MAGYPHLYGIRPMMAKLQGLERSAISEESALDTARLANIRLHRAGWFSGQSQGAIGTDAPRDVMEHMVGSIILGLRRCTWATRAAKLAKMEATDGNQ